VTRLLLDEAKPERILCLTYTKAAAAEMQTRLFAQLGDLAMLSDSDLASRLSRICGRAPPQSAWPRARRLFAAALETPGGLKIQTIHSFCQNVLARFPLEAGVPPGFRVLDERTAISLLEEARERTLARAGRGDRTIAAAIARLVTEISEVRLNEILRNSLGTDRRRLDRFLDQQPGSELAVAIRRAHGLGAAESEDDVVLSFCMQRQNEHGRLLETAKWLARGAKSDRDRAVQLRLAVSADTPRNAFEAFRKSTLKGDGARLKKLATQDLARGDPALLLYLEQLAGRVSNAEARRRDARGADLTIALMTLALAVRGEYEALKRARGALDYDDLVVRTKSLLERSNTAQWVLFKLDGGIDHILIDEAQDTSPEQWAIVSKLTEEFFAGIGARSDRIVRTIFAVGDEKQSIFSFQGAEPSLFRRFGDAFAQWAEAADREFERRPLATSRRSAPEILGFIDAVFATPEARDGLTGIDAQVRHFAHRATAVGKVELWPTLKATEPAETAEDEDERLAPREGAAATLARKIAAHIHEWIEKRVRLPQHENPVRPGDIMILLPRRLPFAPLIIRALKERNIPVAGADRMRLTEEIAIQDLVALGRFVIQPKDDLTLASLLKSPLCGLDDDVLLRLCPSRKATLWEELQTAASLDERVLSAREFLRDMLARADFVPPFEFYAHALTSKGMRRKLLERLGGEAQDPIDEFLSLALAYEAASVPSLEGFLAWIERAGTDVRRDMDRGRDEVRVMTIHGAKGLEADIVFLPDTTTVPQSPTQTGRLLFAGDSVFFPLGEMAEGPDSAKGSAHDAALREHRRLLYVALSRAKDRLYISGFETRRGIAPGSWYRLAEAAARRIGTQVDRDGESIWTVGPIGEQYELAIEPRDQVADIPAWVGPAPKEPRRGQILRPSEIATSDEFLADSVQHPKNRVQATARGLLVHALLAQLPGIDRTGREEKGLRFLEARGWSGEAAREVLRETLAVLDHPEFAGAFGPNSKAEISLAAELPELGHGARVDGRIDRLAVERDRILIIDFKTGQPVPANESKVRQSDLAQMALYRAAAAKIFPERRISCAFVWTAKPQLMKLGDAVLDEQLTFLRQRLDPDETRS
jgi:ATP-dependent helicase/nuclease subunit A